MEIMQAIGEVWTAIITWIVSAIQALVPVFYAAETGFTFLGVLALIGLGLAVVFLDLRGASVVRSNVELPELHESRVSRSTSSEAFNFC